MQKGENWHSITIVGDSVQLAVGTYPLTGRKAGGFTGSYSFAPDPASFADSFHTTNTFTGQLTIKYYDRVNRIVSGTFYFDAVNNAGQKVEVQEGRFDVKLGY